ncbi:MAG: response regulator, partial [Anaerolineales bacterium]|nr:response regulator [Anaerolineales bacterium]
MSEKARILLIDDDPDVQRMIGLILHRAGYEVFKADNGVEGLEKIDALKPDLVILDVMMPLVSGLNVCRRIRSQPHTRHLPVLMLSAMAGADDFVKGFDVGADNYATKPINAKELVARVRALLNRVTTPAPKRAARTISLVGAKGGVGVTSTAANLAVSLTQQGHQVVLIELRPFGGALRFQLQIDREQDNLAHLLALDPKRIKRPEIERCLVKHSSGLRAILPAPDPHALPLTAGHVEALFDYLSLHVDYILLDLPPAVDEHLQRALALSDQILLVTEPEPLAVKCARTQISAFKRWDVFERVNLVIVQRALSAASLNRVEVENLVGMGGDQVGAARWESRALEVDYRMRQGAVSSIPAAPELFHEAMRDRVPVV